VQDCKENYGCQDQGDGGGKDEDDGEEEVVCRVLHEEECEELSVELDLRQPLVEAQGRGGTIGHQSLVVAVVGVAHDGEDVSQGEDDGGEPGGPHGDIYLMGEDMMLQD